MLTTFSALFSFMADVCGQQTSSVCLPRSSVDSARWFLFPFVFSSWSWLSLSYSFFQQLVVVCKLQGKWLLWKVLVVFLQTTTLPHTITTVLAFILLLLPVPLFICAQEVFKALLLTFSRLSGIWKSELAPFLDVSLLLTMFAVRTKLAELSGLLSYVGNWQPHSVVC